MKIKLKNRKNNNTETFNDLSLENISAFVDKEFEWNQENEIGFIYLYYALGELSFQNNETIECIIEGLNYKVSQVREPNEKDRYNICLLRLLNNIKDIVSQYYIGKYEDSLELKNSNKEVLLERHSSFKYTIYITRFLNQLDIDLVVE